MNYLNRYSHATMVREVALILVAVIWWVPLYLLLSVALKPAADVTRSPMALPTQLDVANFAQAWQGSSGVGLGAALLNSVVITAGSVTAVIVIGGISAYVVARQGPRLGTALYLAF